MTSQPNPLLYFKLLRHYTRSPLDSHELHKGQVGTAMEKFIGVFRELANNSLDFRTHMFETRYCTKCGSLHKIVDPHSRIASFTVTSCMVCHRDDSITVRTSYTSYNPLASITSKELPLEFRQTLDLLVLENYL